MSCHSSIAVAQHEGAYLLRLTGELRCKQADALVRFQHQLSEETPTSLLVDLALVDFLDSTMLGSLARIGMLVLAKTGIKPLVVLPEGDIPRLFESMGLYEVFQRTADADQSLGDLQELSLDGFDQLGADELRDQVLSAHKALIELKEDNREIFAELLDELENKY